MNIVYKLASCKFDASCPAIVENDRQYILIGKIVDADWLPELKKHIGQGEIAIEVPAKLLEDAFSDGVVRISFSPCSENKPV